MFKYEISRFSDAVAASYMAKIISSKHGFSESAQTEIAISVSELTTNLVKYAGRGEVEFGFDGREFHIYARNSGLGLKDIELAFTDYCTDSMRLSGEKIPGHKGRGVGLSAVRRLMDECQVNQNIEDGLTIKASKKLC